MLTLTLGAGCAAALPAPAPEESAAASEKVVPENPRVFIDARPFLPEDLFREGIAEAARKGDEQEKEIRAMVVPHHAVAAALSARWIGMLAKQKPPKIILLAPNHYSAGQSSAGTAADWQCYGEVLSADKEALLRLADQGLVHLEDDIFRNEHSLGMLMPLIANYLPDAEVIPIMFHHKFGVEKLEKILDALKPEMEEGAVVIASIDFSHYLPQKEAEAKDEKMRTYLENGDTDIIRNLDSSFVDSPTILAAMLDYFGTENMEIVDNTNSGVLLRNPADGCTSYFTLKFTQEEIQK